MFVVMLSEFNSWLDSWFDLSQFDLPLNLMWTGFPGGSATRFSQAALT
jgi:hypothetical protein